MKLNELLTIIDSGNYIHIVYNKQLYKGYRSSIRSSVPALLDKSVIDISALDENHILLILVDW